MVKFIEYDGKKLPIRISYYALKMTKEETGRSLSKAQDEDYELYEVLAYHALVSGARATKQECQIKREEVVDFMDECFQSFLKLVPEFFPATEETKPPASPEAEKAEVTKK